MIAWKFLAPGAIGPFSRVTWPTPAGDAPAPWVEAKVHPCTSGIHACEVSDLPYWLHAELWEIELDGSVARAGHKIVAPRGRLLRRIEAWDRNSMLAFCAACTARVRAVAARSEDAAEYLLDLEADANRSAAATVGFIAAHAIGAADGVEAAERERAAQAGFLFTQLGLDVADG
jgi:hypothetical protein